jgi:hypothetical protein
MAIKSFNILRSGTFTASAGHRVSFSDADLKLTAAYYPLMAKKAPLVLGHPESNEPSLGEVIDLRAKGSNLYALAEVSTELISLVRTGAYLHVSSAFFPLGDPRNPRSDLWGLRHVGFLGAVAPAVKGLERLDFAEPASTLSTVSNPRLPIEFQEHQAAFADYEISRYSGLSVRMQAGALHDRFRQIPLSDCVGIIEANLKKTTSSTRI